ncbi:MAG: SHOCT domain-containing protein [Bdellovibrionaceae bacterium]|nr:SHOCT domain-containing protein [Pseudobdellovibrionaceae bacterium]
MSQDSIKIKGVQDILEVFEDKLTITPNGVLGFINKGLKGTKEIPFRSIHAIQIKKASMLINGFIQFSISGGKESKSGIFGATQDENTFMFNAKMNDEIERVKIFIESKQRDALKVAGPQTTKTDELIKLNELLKSGAINEEEFNSMKKEIIGKAS